MFSFTADSFTIIEKNAKHGDMIVKYPDNYMIIMNGHIEDEEIHGDVVQVLTAKEYNTLEKPKNIAPKFGVWVGKTLELESMENRLGLR